MCPELIFFPVFFTGVLIEPQLAEWYEAEDYAWCPAGMHSDPACPPEVHPPEGNKNMLNLSFFQGNSLFFTK